MNRKGSRRHLFALFYKTEEGEPLVGVVGTEAEARALAAQHDTAHAELRWEEIITAGDGPEVFLLIENGTLEDGHDTGFDPVVVGAFHSEQEAGHAASRLAGAGLHIRRFMVGAVDDSALHG